jgi:DnaJ-class molecular chaperone
MSESEKREETAMEKLPELETKCPQCNGRGRWGSDGTCDLCDGTGYQLTDAGDKVLRLIRRRFCAMFKEVISSE